MGRKIKNKAIKKENLLWPESRDAAAAGCASGAAGLPGERLQNAAF